MAEPPGPMDGSQVGKNYIDQGTLVTGRTPTPAPAGAETACMDYGPAALAAMIEDCLKTLAASPWASSVEGKHIVPLLGRFKRSSGGISFGDTGGARGTFEGTRLVISQVYCGKAASTILELVHEASHAYYDTHHPRSEVMGFEDIVKLKAESEYYCVVNQIEVYKWLQKKYPGFTDVVMDERVHQQNQGEKVLWQAILASEQSDMEANGIKPGETIRRSKPAGPKVIDLTGSKP